MRIRIKSLAELVDNESFVGIENTYPVKLLTIDNSYMSCSLDIDHCEEEIEIFPDNGRYISDGFDFFSTNSSRQALIDNLSEIAFIIEDDKVHELSFGTIVYNEDRFVLSSDDEEIDLSRKEVVDVVNYFLDCLGYHGIEE